jgi:TonB family protein
MWMATARSRQPERASEANSLYLQALARAGVDSIDAENAMRLYAVFLRQQGRTDEAAQYADNAQSILQKRVNGQPSGNAVRVGPGIQAPKLLHKIEPEYTPEARMVKTQGTVLLTVEIQPDGHAANIRVQRSIGLGLDEKAVEAVSQWVFQPGMIGNQPVIVAANIEVNFRLQ